MSQEETGKHAGNNSKQEKLSWIVLYTQTLNDRRRDSLHDSDSDIRRKNRQPDTNFNLTE